ncbi:hypothetical protein PspLS_11821 [Pyricularia sp. CBS 133598]|nr:hypothetical protein PspLS_11821 [Pyricularia sp. CBS 133598]
MIFDPDTDLINLVLGFHISLRRPHVSQLSRVQESNQHDAGETSGMVWIVLVTAGFVAGFGTSIYMQMWHSPQVRFCPATSGPNVTAEAYDKLHRALKGPNEELEAWIHDDWDRWNRTVSTVFGNKSTTASDMRCIYPSADFEWPIRDPAEMRVKAFQTLHFGSGGSPPAFDELHENRFLRGLEITASVVVPVAGLVLAVMMNTIAWKDPRNEFYEGFVHLGQWGFPCNILVFAGGVFVAGPDGDNSQRNNPPGAPKEYPLSDLA